MNEKTKQFLKSLCKLVLQGLLILAAVFIGLYLFAGLVIFGALSRS